ncbi:S-acyl fatty acid synthase thioesterase, medium chain [Eptesicus fuscus]|uniref:S-acyl fatty acid synthase thioesterase, medium chain n=1 Tax=Eptesicus fuscus TaxID=29078 RepID=UPI00240477B3|nr:S-acyl fatty acid synthase thioesterase, medium chain [Eptesicus fuscus]XP_054582019.1 S-acyl fatty acid synthase thioesterase, medium chain [Eptesicus fuscus]
MCTRGTEFAIDPQAAKISNWAPSPHNMEKENKAGAARNEKAVSCLYRKPNAVFRLICFPWAGSGSLYFAKWGKKMNDLLEVHSIRLAGRESRFEEPFASDIYQIVDEIVCVLLPVLQDKPFAFFGHSMGAYIAFMTALHLKEKHKLEPMHLFVSSATPLHSKARYRVPEDEELSEEHIRSFILNLGGTPTDFINDKEISQQHLSRLMADARILRNITFNAPSEAILSCDLTCFVGSEDIVKDIEAWEDVISGSFHIHVRPGNHFYLMETSNETFIMNYITKCLEISMLA